MKKLYKVRAELGYLGSTCFKEASHYTAHFVISSLRTEPLLNSHSPGPFTCYACGSCFCFVFLVFVPVIS